MNNRQLIFAREYRGYSQTELASKIAGLSQSNLSKFEKGLGGLSEEVLTRIMDFLGFPISFLDLELRVYNNGHYRKKASIKASTRKYIEKFVSVVAYVVDWMSEEVEFPDFNFNYIDVESGVSPEEIARLTRTHKKLGNLPIRDIFGLLESNGVVIYQWDCDIKEFDGVSVLTDKGRHIVVMNRNMSNDRKRFTLAHELGHIIMHQCPDFIVVDARDKEQEAHRFASEFLMPELAIRPYLVNLTIKKLMENKKYWLTSMASQLKRAKTIGIIEENKHNNLLIELSRRGWRIQEPNSVIIDRPVAFETAESLFRTELHYDLRDIAGTIMLPMDIIKSIFSIKRPILLPQ